MSAAALWAVYAVAVVVFVVVAWMRIGEFDRINEELERRKRTP